MIVGEPITLHLSEAEADVIQHALSSWIGPFGKLREEVDPRSHSVHDSKTTLACQMCEDIRTELCRRYELWKSTEEGKQYTRELNHAGRQS